MRRRTKEVGPTVRHLAGFFKVSVQAPTGGNLFTIIPRNDPFHSPLLPYDAHGNTEDSYPPQTPMSHGFKQTENTCDEADDSGNQHSGEDSNDSQPYVGDWVQSIKTFSETRNNSNDEFLILIENQLPFFFIKQFFTTIWIYNYVLSKIIHTICKIK